MRIVKLLVGKLGQNILQILVIIIELVLLLLTRCWRCDKEPSGSLSQLCDRLQ